MWFCVERRVEGMRFDHRQRPSYTALSFCLYLVNEQCSAKKPATVCHRERPQIHLSADNR